MSELPGKEILEQGAADLRAGRLTVLGLLLAIGAPRLRRVGAPLPDEAQLPGNPEHRLYELVGSHSAYNAWLRRLVSLERALEARRGREARSSSPGSPTL